MSLFSQVAMECRQQFRRPFVWFCFAAFFGLAFFDTMQTGLEGQGNSWVNGAAMIANRGIVYSLIGVVAVAGIVLEPFVRDRAHGTRELILTTPVGRFGRGPLRFVVAFAIVVLATLLFIPGMILGAQVPGVPAELVGPTVPGHYLKTTLCYLLPNYFLVAALVYAVGNRFENRSLGYAAAVATVAGWVTFRTMLGRDIFHEEVFARYALLDPFGSIASFEGTREQTVAQKNLEYPPFGGLLLANRMLWLGIAIVVFGLGTLAIPMRLRLPRARSERRLQPASQQGSSRLETALRSGDGQEPRRCVGAFGKFVRMLGWDLRLVRRQPSSLLTLGLVAFTLWWSASGTVRQQFSLPSTDLLVHNTDFYFGKILMLAIVWVAGSLAWRDRSLRVHELTASQPVSDGAAYLAHTVALLLVVAAFWLVSIGVNVLYQLSHGYTRLELGLHFTDSFVFKAPYFLCFALLAVALQAIVCNRSIAIVLVLAVALASVLLDALGVRHPMFHFGRVSHVWYSLMDGYGHFWTAHRWMLGYWALGALLVWLLGYGAFTRCTDPPGRWATFRARFRGAYALLLPGVAVAFLATAYFVHRGSVANGAWPPVDENAVKAEIERTFAGEWRERPQPRIVAIEAEADLWPDKRRWRMAGRFTLENPGDAPIDEVLVLATAGLAIESLDFEGGASRTARHPELNVQVWQLDQPLAGGARATLDFVTSHAPPPGFVVHSGADSVPDVAPNELIGNGSSMLNLELMPVIGYTDRVEHKPRWQRRKYGLPEEWSPPAGDGAASVGHGTLHLSWVESLTMTLRTAADQTALHAGVLEDSWQEPDGRNGFRYRIDGKSRGWSAIVSGRFEKRVFERPGIPDVEVYFDPQHEPSVDPFGTALQEAIAYFAERYGPPPFEVFRLAEQSLHYDGFGCRGGLAHASEIFGWKADLAAGGDEEIRRMAAIMVALSWWGDQVIPANVAGAKLIHAGLPYWTAALYLHETRDADTDRRLRLQSMMELFRGRGEMVDVEQPFVTEFKDSAMIRNKGSILFVNLAELIGPEELSEILAEWLEHWRFRPAPYPTAADLLGHLRERVPSEFQGFLDDLFEQVTVWRTEVREVGCEPTADGRWRLSATVSARKEAVSGWGEERALPFETPVELVAYRDGGFGPESLIRSEWRTLESGEQTIEWLLDEKPLRFGVDPRLLLPDPDPHNNLRRVP